VIPATRQIFRLGLQQIIPDLFLEDHLQLLIPVLVLVVVLTLQHPVFLRQYQLRT